MRRTRTEGLSGGKVEDDDASSCGCATGAGTAAVGAVAAAMCAPFLTLPLDVFRDEPDETERPGSRVLASRSALTSKLPPVVIWKGICTSVYPAKRKR